MTPPPASGSFQARPHVDCTSSYWAPIADSAIAAYEIGGAAYAATLDDSRFDRYPITRKEDIALGGVFGAVFAGSAIYGYVEATRCRRIKRGTAPPQYLPGVSSNQNGFSGRPGLVP
jgi:hypothetical protein